MSLIAAPLLKSEAGTWGIQRKSELLRTDGGDPKVFKTTEFRESFNDKAMQDLKEKQKNQFAKFRTLTSSNPKVLSYGESGVQLEEMLEYDPTFRNQKSAKPYDMYSTTSSLIMGPKEGTLPVSLERTNRAVLRSSDVEPAVGRSGQRPEQGVSTSGLSGERLCLASDPMSNTFAQRSWLYHDDPALHFKMLKEKGMSPVAFVPNDVSLDVGGHNKVAVGWVHQRKAVLTGDPLSKAGNKRAGVFMDEFPF